MTASPSIRRAHTRLQDPVQAVQAFHAEVAQEDMALVLFFCSSHYDLDLLATEMYRQFMGVQVVGCTTAGEIGPQGYMDHSLSGVSFSARHFSVVSGLIESLHTFEIRQGVEFAKSLISELESCSPEANAKNSFAFLMIDGMSQHEEPVTRSLSTALGNIPIFGGSAGDDMIFDKTWIYCNGAFHTDCAALVLASTDCPFKTFKTQHFTATDQRLVVTEADASRRLVTEINGLPAAEEYARLVGVDVDDLNPFRFATSPVVVLIDGMEYVRSIQKANPDGSLTLYCAIEEGIVLRVARGVDLMENLRSTFAQVDQEIGEPQLILACDCILRNLEITQDGSKENVAQLLTDHKVVGFSTYGEQFAGVHVNQTFTALAIGSTPDQQP
ncbi:FIST domain containing protein [Hahella sp. CCB-MM4]|uniref:nitric oxide-sensing protein NosP n=1 Tax=Hahella sp. (strain CCB-MM4) TaxID=1926491 RepID=UPI000B9AA794|nr:nitric oxide-sensing protein NosP [Hahella sp. CCB-MM4]OZG71095.1 FIST domain containing protein [Hahella sp. CCB-MM4]